jgi:hypothetical protein
MNTKLSNKIKQGVVASLIVLAGVALGKSVQATDLSVEAQDKLAYIYEEEKLARDVYLFLYDMWGTRIFDNISGSEQTHMNQIKTLLTRYNVPAPMAGNGPGMFSNPEFQSLYNKLTEIGSVSKTFAFQVGVIIEQTDIEDLTEGLTLTSYKDITNVLNNLRSASYNHLSAFQSRLE